MGLDDFFFTATTCILVCYDCDDILKLPYELLVYPLLNLSVLELIFDFQYHT